MLWHFNALFEGIAVDPKAERSGLPPSVSAEGCWFYIASRAVGSTGGGA